MHPHRFLNNDSDLERSTISGSTVSLLTSQQIELGKYACEPRWQGLLAEHALAKQYLEQKGLVDLITADHRVLNEESESQNNHRDAVVVQDLATQWIQSCPCKTKTFSGDGKEFKNVSRAVWKAKSQLHWQFVGIGQILWISIMESSYFDTRSIRDEWDCWESGGQNKRRNVCSTVAILLGWKVVAWVFGMLLQSAKCSRPLGRRAKLLMKAELENHFKGPVSSKIQINLRFTFRLKPGQRRRPLQNLQRNENSWLTLEHQCTCWAEKDLRSGKLDTLRKSRNPTTVVTANGEVQTNKEAQVYVYDPDLFVKVQILEDTPAVVSLRKLCEEHGYTYECASGQKPHLTKQGKKILPNQKKRDNNRASEDRLRFARSSKMAGGVRRTSRRYRSACTRTDFSIMTQIWNVLQ